VPGKRAGRRGASNPHPHGQIWANERLPSEPALELHHQREYAGRGGCLLCDYLAAELTEQERIICQNGQFVALVPFWAVWPFETLVLPVVTAVPCLTCMTTNATGW
jgi:UDPglucose--hexose-1-phosphate uridylyltransferase